MSISKLSNGDASQVTKVPFLTTVIPFSAQYALIRSVRRMAEDALHVNPSHLCFSECIITETTYMNKSTLIITANLETPDIAERSSFSELLPIIV